MSAGRMPAVPASTTAADAAQLASRLRRWLASSECQSGAGAFCAWVEEDGGLSYEYPEISGYALTHFAGLDDAELSEIESGRRAADWLVRRLRSGDFSARAEWDQSAVYTFDLAMLATGLLLFGSQLGTEEHLAYGDQVVDFLCQEAERVARLPATASRGPATGRSGWSTDGRAHMLKAVQCLLLSERLTGNPRSSLAQSLVDEADQLQQEDGRFVTDAEDEVTMLHPHLYAVEGLWIFGTAQSSAEALDRARSGIYWAWRQQLPNGGFPRFVPVDGAKSAGAPEQADVTAQAARLALLLDPQLPGIDRAVSRLGEVSIGDAEECALPYQPGAEPAHRNVWATLFGAQAASLAAADGAPRLDWRHLV